MVVSWDKLTQFFRVALHFKLKTKFFGWKKYLFPCIIRTTKQIFYFSFTFVSFFLRTFQSVYSSAWKTGLGLVQWKRKKREKENIFVRVCSAIWLQQCLGLFFFVMLSQTDLHSTLLSTAFWLELFNLCVRTCCDRAVLGPAKLHTSFFILLTCF